MQSVNLLLSHTIYVSFYILIVTFFLCVQLYAGQMDRKFQKFQEKVVLGVKAEI